jgi:protein-S-isoprenylcysteine O-methyltransferase Ste14
LAQAIMPIPRQPLSIRFRVSGFWDGPKSPLNLEFRGTFPMKRRFLIDTHKAATGPVILILIAIYQQWDNPTAWIYLALHGTYGVLWVLKSRVFPDKSWETEASRFDVFYFWGGMTLYWVAPWLIASRGVTAPPWLAALCVSIYAFGVFFHFAADMQKHVALNLRQGRLITTGLFARCRNPNYFGELLIYSAFGLLALHWLPLLILLIIIAAVWLPNMRRKDRSLARYPEFEAYRKSTRLFIPFVF